MRQTFTLDTNCVIDVAEKRPAAKAVQALADAHAAGKADVAVIAITASEKKQDEHYSGVITSAIWCRVLSSFTIHDLCRKKSCSPCGSLSSVKAEIRALTELTSRAAHAPIKPPLPELTRQAPRAGRRLGPIR